MAAAFRLDGGGEGVEFLGVPEIDCIINIVFDCRRPRWGSFLGLAEHMESAMGIGVL